MTVGGGAGDEVRAVRKDGSVEIVSLERSDEMEGEGRRGGGFCCEAVDRSDEFVEMSGGAAGDDAAGVDV